MRSRARFFTGYRPGGGVAGPFLAKYLSTSLPVIEGFTAALPGSG
ncbi:hypothetical protein ASZ90_009286 [hydrocarbon metagenome]|uniref:Uncharacterized protein n=1 Tax=hydrocarbon metagenome TaxID=938273 RepID=A0A0W8FJ68_9ZZZZ